MPSMLIGLAILNQRLYKLTMRTSYSLRMPSDDERHKLSILWDGQRKDGLKA